MKYLNDFKSTRWSSIRNISELTYKIKPYFPNQTSMQNNGEPSPTLE